MYSHIQKILSSSVESKFATTAKEYNKSGESIPSHLGKELCENVHC